MLHQKVTPLLGRSYRENDYSPGFHKIINQVASKIYHKKGMRRPLFLSNIYKIPDQQQQHNTPANLTFQRVGQNLPIQAISYERSRNLQGLLLKKIEQKQRESYRNSQKKIMNTYSDYQNATYQNEPQNIYSMRFQRKTNEYNKYLITRTFRLQEKSKQLANLNYSSTRKQSQFNNSPTLRKKPYNITTKQIGFGPKVSNQATRSVSLPISIKNDFKPWQTKQVDQFPY